MDWTWILIGLGITALFFVPSAVLRWGRRAERRDVLSLLAAEPLITAPPVPSGPVQLQGRCRADAALCAPLSGRPCVGFCLDVYIFVDDTDGGYHWTLAAIEELFPCALELGDASVALDVDRVTLWLAATTSTQREGPLNELPTRLLNRVRAQARERYAKDRPDIIPRPSQEVRLVERILPPGATALIVGQARQERDAASAKLRDRVGPRPGQTLLVFGGSRAELEAALRAGLDAHWTPT